MKTIQARTILPFAAARATSSMLPQAGSLLLCTWLFFSTFSFASFSASLPSATRGTSETAASANAHRPTGSLQEKGSSECDTELGFLEEWKDQEWNPVSKKQEIIQSVQVRPAFRYTKKDGWVPFTSESWKKHVEKTISGNSEVRHWIVVSKGRKKGEVQTENIPPGMYWKNIHLQRVKSSPPAPVLEFGSEEITVSDYNPIKRPLVACSKPFFKDKEGWELQPAPAEISAQVFEAFRKTGKLLHPLPAVTGTGPEELFFCSTDDLSELGRSDVFSTGTLYGNPGGFQLIGKSDSPLPYARSDLEHYQVWKSRGGRFLFGVRFRERVLATGRVRTIHAGDTYHFVHWFAAEEADGNLRFLGPAMTLLDIGDYDNDGRSEFVFWLSLANYNGYRIFWNDLRNSATVDWSGH